MLTIELNMRHGAGDGALCDGKRAVVCNTCDRIILEWDGARWFDRAHCPEWELDAAMGEDVARLAMAALAAADY